MLQSKLFTTDSTQVMLSERASHLKLTFLSNSLDFESAKSFCSAYGSEVTNNQIDVDFVVMSKCQLIVSPE